MTRPLQAPMRALAMLLLTLILGAPQALAHAVLLSSTPMENAMVEAAPEAVTLGFNEPVSLLTATLITPDGESLPIVAEGLGGSTLAIPLPADLGEGTHVLSWRVVSADGHPVGGANVFSIGIVTGAASGAVVVDPAIGALLWGAKALLYGVLLFGLGSAVYAVVFAQGEAGPRRLVFAMMVGGLVLAPLSLGLQGVDALGGRMPDLISPASWATGMATSYGWTALILMAAFALGIIGFGRGAGRGASILAGSALLLAGLALARSGHASAADPQGLTRPAVFFHILGIVLWAGALLPLRGALAEGRSEGGALLSRFSRFIPYPVGAILISGVVLGVVQLGQDVSSWVSGYGFILLAKLVLLAIVFGLALYNRLVLTGRALEGDRRARRAMGKSILAEIALMALVLLLVAGWRFTPPPRALAEAAALPIAMHIHTEALMADLEITPARPGPNAIAVYLMDGDFAAVSPQSVEILVSAPERGIEPTRVPTSLGEDGYWRAEGVTLPLAGAWQIDLEIRLSRFQMVRLGDSFTLP
ncbi:copper resistance CopC/CopD family protein [Arsenicitalea aurantiaca]|nr:copper resistance protein CopC [Arsenicitalea aurantiaca]